MDVQMKLALVYALSKCANFSVEETQKRIYDGIIQLLHSKTNNSVNVIMTLSQINGEIFCKINNNITLVNMAYPEDGN